MAQSAAFAALFLGATLAACAGGSGGVAQTAEIAQADAPVPAQVAGRGTLVLDGGGYSNTAITDRIVSSIGQPARLCLIDTAAGGKGRPQDFFSGYRGLQLTLLSPQPEDTADASLADALRGCSGYYFNGGDPQLLSTTFLPDGRDSPALGVIRERYRQQGALVAGSSAGAMIAGATTLCECGDRSSVTALLQGQLFQAPGFRLVRGVLVDAHFFARGLLGRHVYALANTGTAVGIGIDEETAVVVPPDGPWEVIGRRAVAVIEMAPDATLADLGDFRLSTLAPGDRFDPLTGEFLVAPDRARLELRREPASAPPTTGGIFAAQRVPALLRALVDGPAEHAVGLAAGGRIRITFRKTADTAAYGRGEVRTILRVAVTIERKP